MKHLFPLFENNPGLVYLDYANTAPKPQSVIEAITAYYSEYSGNVHRASYDLGARADDAYEGARAKIACFINAQANEIVFTKNATEGVNLVAQSFVGPRLRTGDTILLTGLEHHANLVSWQLLAGRTSAKIVFSKLNPNGTFDFSSWQEKLSQGPKFAAFSAVSNVTGEHLPIAEMCSLARQHGVPTLIDAAQAAAHQKVDVVALDVDFLVFTGHKLYGPTGVGVLYGRYELLDEMPPWLGGGDMIADVTYESATFQKPPLKFEAGTPPIASVIGLGAAIDFLESHQVEQRALMQQLISELSELEGLKFMGQPTATNHLVTMTVDGVHALDLGTYLNEKQIAVRVGKLCAHPLFEVCGVNSGLRASIGHPTDASDIERFLETVRKGVKLLR